MTFMIQYMISAIQAYALRCLQRNVPWMCAIKDYGKIQWKLSGCLRCPFIEKRDRKPAFSPNWKLGS